MHRQNFVLAMLASASLGFAMPAVAQQGAYQGISQPPADVINTTPEDPPAKPSAAVLATVPAQPTSQDPSANYATTNYNAPASQQALRQRTDVADPDGDIVQPRPARAGELMEGATIRVKLLDRLSSSESEKGEAFRGQVASDVMQDGRVLIPAGSAIEGKVTSASSGHFGGHGSLRLRPDTVILPDGSRYQIRAEATGTRGSKTRIGGEGTITPGSRAKRDGVEYGAVVGTGIVTGAVIAGPVGALTGGLIGAGLVTTHLMVNHPQATLEPGSQLIFTLTEPMNLSPTTN